MRYVKNSSTHRDLLFSGIKEIKAVGYSRFLIGGNFMEIDNPGLAIKDFVAQIK